MKRVIGIGGIFFKAKDPKALQDWYKLHLGIDVQDWGGAAFDWKQKDGKLAGEATAWRIAPVDDESFSPSTSPFMVNYLVADLTGLLTLLREEGCHVIGEFDEGEYGKFGWVLDPEGNKVELWEPFSKI
ncbi:MAG: VOC family protein [Candidatus Saccharimonadales bacterium]